MRILIAAASEQEIKHLRDSLQLIHKIDQHLANYRYGNLVIDLLVTGVGSVHMTYHLVKTFHSFSYDLAINIGVAESFDHFLEQGFVVNVVQEQFADLGFEDHGKFYTLAEKELQDEDAFPYTGDVLHSLGSFEIEEVDALIPVKGITVNKLQGNLDSIEKIKEKFNPEIETLEGAAFFYTCLLEKIPFLEIRAISNFVEFRRIENWSKPMALDSLSKSVLAIFNELKID